MRQYARKIAPGSKLRILAAHPEADGYGADLMLTAALRALRDRGADVTVAIAEDGPLVQQLVREDFDVEIFEVPILRKSLLEPLAFARFVASSVATTVRLWAFLRRRRPDVVYVNTVTLPHWIVASRLAGVPVVCHVREAEDGPPAVVQRALTAPLLLCRRVIANSAHTAAHLSTNWAAVGRRVEVVHNGFRFDAAPPWRPPDPSGEILLVGRLSPRKGQDTAIRALAILRERGYGLRLRLIGTAFEGYDWFVRDLEDLVDEAGLTGLVIFDGYRTDVVAANAAADLVIVPSRIEPFGNVAVEALAANRPLVVSAVGGLCEIVLDGETGLQVPPDDPGALADALERLLEDPVDAARLAGSGSVRVREHFSLERYAREVHDVLRRSATAAP